MTAEFVKLVLAGNQFAAEAKWITSALLGSWLVWRSFAVAGVSETAFAVIHELCAAHLQAVAVVRA